MSCKSTGRHYSTSGTWGQQISSTNWPSSPTGLKPSRSDPSLVPQPSAIPAQATVMVVIYFLCHQSTKTCSCVFMGTNINKLSCFQRARGQAFQSQKSLQTQMNRHSTYSTINGTQMTTSQTRFVQPSSGLFQTDGKMGTIKASKLEHSSAYVHLVFFHAISVIKGNFVVVQYVSLQSASRLNHIIKVIFIHV